MNTTEKTLVYLALGLSVLALIFAFSGSSVSLGGASNINCNGRAYCTAFVDMLFRNGSSTDTFATNNLTATGTATLATTNISGAVALTSTLTVGSGGTAINKYLCGTKSYEPGLFTSTSTASTTISVSGAALGDVVLTSFSSATSSGLWATRGNVIGSGTTTVTFFTTASGTVTLTTSTLKACVIN